MTKSDLLRTRKQHCFLAGFICLMAGQITLANTKTAVTATQLTNNNVTALQRQGPDAIGGLNDWFISNGTLCAIVSDVEHESEFSTKGGSLVDLGFCGRADDYFGFSHDLINGSRRRPLNAESVRIETFNGESSIVVESSGDGARLSTRYYFDPNMPTQLHISKRYQAIQGESVNFVSPLNFNLRSLQPFVFNSREPQYSNGFQNQDFVTRGLSAIRVAARYADTVILPSPRFASHPISYGWQLKHARRVEQDQYTNVPFFILADNDSIAMMVLSDTFYLGNGKNLGWLQLPQIPLLTLKPEAVLETHEVIYVGQGGDVATITNQMISDGSRVSGWINEPDSAVHVKQRNGAPLTYVTPDKRGNFQFIAPKGDYYVNVLADADRKLNASLTVTEQTLTTPLVMEKLTLPEATKLQLPQDQAMRLVFVGANDTPTPDFNKQLTGASIAFDNYVETRKPVSAVFLAGVDSDLKEVAIAAGEYWVYATKGPEYSLEKTYLTINDVDKAPVLDIKIPERVIDTPNHIASDLHVHSGLSFDNAFAETERVRSFVAEHGEVMVSSEHDLPTDFTPYISQMGVADKIVSIPAAEMTSLLPTSNNPYTGGHANVFPFKPKHTHYRNGMISHEHKRLRDVIHSVKQANPGSVVQLNHPRNNDELAGHTLPSDWQDIINDGNYLEHMGPAGHPYNAHKELHTHPNNTLIEPHPVTGVRDLDFDLIEVINPSEDHHESRLKAVRQDWLSFLKQGERIVGTANSDSHNALEQVAVPRTMVAMPSDGITEFNQQAFITNLKSGNAYGTTGPMLEITLQGTKMGGTFEGVRGTLTVEVNKAPWIEVNHLDIQINGDTVDTHTLRNIKHQTIKVPLEFTKDSFVTVEVFGSASPDYQAIYPGINPYAFSNPIYVDFDQNDDWQAPGL